MGPTLDYATPADADPGARVWPWRAICPLLLACLYAPYAWILFLDYPWSNYRLMWLKAWPVLPGLGVGLFVRGFKSQLAAMGVVTAAIGFAIWLIVQRRERRRGTVLVVAGVVLALSVVNSVFAYRVFW